MYTQQDCELEGVRNAAFTRQKCSKTPRGRTGSHRGVLSRFCRLKAALLGKLMAVLYSGLARKTSRFGVAYQPEAWPSLRDSEAP